jgi:hypothetical protein
VASGLPRRPDLPRSEWRQGQKGKNQNWSGPYLQQAGPCFNHLLEKEARFPIPHLQPLAFFSSSTLTVPSFPSQVLDQIKGPSPESQATSGFFDLVPAMGSPEEIDPRGSETLPMADKELTDYSHDGDESGREYPTELEMQTLRRVSDHIPWITFSVAFVELCERFSYYGTTVVCMYFLSIFYVSLNLRRGDPLSNDSCISNTPFFSCQFHPTGSSSGIHNRR